MLPEGWWPVIGGGLGLLLGSFIALVTARWPQGETILGRSRCDHCGAKLGTLELLPVLSFLFQRGRCRQCGQPIAARHLQIELAGAVIGGLLLWRYPPLAGAAAAIAGWWLLALIVLDVEHYWLPDRLTLPLIPAGLALGQLIGFAPFGERVMAVAVGFFALWAMRFAYRLRTGREGMGGGDPKLFAAIGALLGAVPLPFLLTASAGLGLALAMKDMLQGRDVNATTRLPLGALLAGMALVFLALGPNWWEIWR
ncbi:A24 family peptidase [Sandarakinorhabdus sp.]|uniref:prepilin peptidase n=1 Tax=Sandarakinorhabdus sp. TaxID=1916663 RepID=UPI00356AF8F4